MHLTESQLREQLEASVREAEQILLASAKEAALARLEQCTDHGCKKWSKGDKVCFQHTDGRLHQGLIQNVHGGLAVVAFLHPCR